MKFLHEYRDHSLANRYLEEIRRVSTRPWSLMEFCGGQTHSLIKNGIVNVLPEGIRMVHGPGCPVCVTPAQMIDQAIELSMQPDVILCSFGDMLRVPGTRKSLLEAKAQGGSVRFFYSPLEAVTLAREHPDKEVVFFAVGFETTAPANALSVLHAEHFGLKNYSILSSHVMVPPAMEAVIADPQSQIDGFLGAGNVCSIMGLAEYDAIVQRHQIPLVVTGFEPVDLLQGILMILKQLEAGVAKLENQYSRVVPYEGNPSAKAMVEKVFSVGDREWRGIGTLSGSGLHVSEAYAAFDAIRKFGLPTEERVVEEICQAGEILKGVMKPHQCPHFGKKCTPLTPVGAPMVSSEGACAAYYHFAQV
ncbi:MAG: hydrogenase formation protein HypD [Bacteroidota bacterium]